MRLFVSLLLIGFGVRRCLSQSSAGDSLATSGSTDSPSSSAASASSNSGASSSPTSGPQAPSATSSHLSSSASSNSASSSATSLSTSSSTSNSAALAVTTVVFPPGVALPDPDPNAFYPYPQPPLPTISATRNSNAWILSPTWKVRARPTTREYTFDIAPAAAAPDGYPRQIYAVNNQFPGPLIEANEGDWVVVHVNNHLNIGQTIHWHGLLQNGTAYMDGIPGISQCPVPPGQSFTYKFRVKGQYGTYFWHSHFGNTMGDGLIGALIVHSRRDPLKRGRDFDNEVVVMISDWMDVQSQTIADALHSNTGYRGSFFAPQGNALTINGVGRTNCSNPDIQDHSLPCATPALAEINVPVGKRTRLRLINAGSNGMFRVSVDQHPLHVIEVDETAVWGPEGIHEVTIATGQRASVVIDATVGAVGDGFYMRAYFVRACHGSTAKRQEGLAIVRYVDSEGNSPSHSEPNTTAWADVDPISAPCIDLDMQYSLERVPPREKLDAPTNILQTYVMSTAAGLFVDKNGVHIGNYGFNNVTDRNQIGHPLLQQVQEGHAIDGQYVAHSSFDQMGGGDIVINNLDAPGTNTILQEPISHPFHLHGKPFFIVARGTGVMTKEKWEASRDELAQTSNPVRRDVLEIAGGSWAVLRLYVDLPGVWALHCHVGWHLSDGKLAAFVYLPDKVKALDKPTDWSNMCSYWGHDELGPARRDVSGGHEPPQERAQPPGSTFKMGKKGPRRIDQAPASKMRAKRMPGRGPSPDSVAKPPARDSALARPVSRLRREADCMDRGTCAELGAD